MQALQSWAPTLIWPNRSDKLACSAPRPSFDMSGLKRKRNDDLYDPPRLPDEIPVKRMRVDQSQEPNTILAPDKEAAVDVESQTMPGQQEPLAGDKSQTDVAMQERAHLSAGPITLPIPANDMTSAKLAKARERIEAQLNLEILLRHEELRLIEQELAKAQVSLEQLRRCHVIPFPGTPGSAATLDQISDGTGPSLEPPSGHTKPAQPSPWGVSDGPYTQHYARWLIPDSVFDSTQPTQIQPRVRQSIGGKSCASSDARGLRGVDRDLTVANRRQRQSISATGTNLNTNVQPKERPSGPLKLKRNDGVWVKLVCRYCRKEDVSSVQGFLNHCRIAHSNIIKSHQEAALVHGIVLSDEELAATPTIPKQTPMSATFGNVSADHPAQVYPLNDTGHAQARSFSFSTPTRPSPLQFTPRPNGTGSAMATPKTASHQPSPPSWSSNAWPHPSQASTIPQINHRKVQHTKEADSNYNPSFVPCASTPSLSALAQKRGCGVDLAKIVTNARQRADMDKVEPLIADSEDEADTSSPPQPAPLASRAPITRAPMPAMIPNSASSSFEPTSHPSCSGESTLNTPSPQSAAPTNDFSPRTAESNPGMVTDHEDDDDEYEEVPDSECGDSMPQSSDHSVRIRGDDDIDMEDADVEDSADTKMCQGGNIDTKQTKRGRPSKGDGQNKRGRMT